VNARLFAPTESRRARRAPALLLLAGLVLLALPATASAREGNWSFHIDYTINPVPDPACGGFAQTDVGTAVGDGSLFKDGLWNSTECIDFLINPAVLTERDGHFTITTQHGTLFGLYDGVGTPTGFGHLRTAANVRLVGGTGPFAHITGCGHALGDSNLLNTADNHLDASGQFGC